MTAVSGAFPNLVGGVSQQPPEIRPVNTSKDLINSISDVATGLATRPFTKYLGKISDAPAVGKTVATHIIQKPSGNFQLAVHSGQVFVLNMDTGVQQVVNYEVGAQDYINTDDAALNIGFVTVADTTFIYNKAVTCTATVASEGATSGGMTVDGLVRLNPNMFGTMWMKQIAGYNCNYALYHNGGRVGLVTTSSMTAADIGNSLAGSSGVSNTRVSQTVWSFSYGAESEYITTEDDYANQAMFSFNDSVDVFTNLPNLDRVGRLVLIKQSKDTKNDDYWVWYKDGSWQETFGWNGYEKPDDATMPHILVDNGDGTWTLKKDTWLGRNAGDSNSNPTPTFIGRTINHMFTYKGRMCLLTDENFVASQVGNFENFYRSSCTQLLDEDPIDVASPDSRGAALKYAVEFANELILTSEFDQFTVTGDANGLLSPNTVQIKHTNNYNVSGLCRPAFVGQNFLFIDDFQKGKYAMVKEYQIDRTWGRQIALSITDEVSEYIPSGVYRMASSSSRPVVAVVTKGDRRHLWFYNYYYNNNGYYYQKVQSSWQKWAVNFDIYGVGFVDDILVITAAHDTGLYVLDVKFSFGSDSIIDETSVLLDMRLSSDSLTKVYTGGNTQFTLPYSVESATEFADLIAVVSPTNTGSLVKGRILTPSSFSGNTLTFNGADLTADQLFIGFRYEFSWLLNPIYMRDPKQVAIQDGRLQLRHISFLYNNSGPFVVHVTPEGRDEYQDPFSAFILGSTQSTLGTLAEMDGKFRASVYGRGEVTTVVVKAKTPWRVRFSSIEWDGSYRPRKQRTT